MSVPIVPNAAAAGAAAVPPLQVALRRITARDAEVRAWTHLVLPDAAQPLPQGEGRPLEGVPVGVKDVIDVAGMPTRHNSPLGSCLPALADAPCVAVLRAAGAVIVGKTDTTEFAAAGRNAATANPHALHRTPGGSSAGSAAAVADGHVPLAIATQTGGSTIRPASFCGVHALKPTWGAISREGVKLYANSLDTVGFHASDLDLLDAVAAQFGLAAPPAVSADAPLSIAVCRTPWWQHADAETRAALDDAAARLRAAGARVAPITLPDGCDALEEAFLTILYREGGAAFLDLARRAPDLLHADFHARVNSTEHYPDAALRRAYDRTAHMRVAVEALFASFDAVLVPSAPGIAPEGRGPGNPIFNQHWTLLHLPVVNLPLYRAQQGMPLGLSLVGLRFADRALLQVGQRVMALLGRDHVLTG